jgi:hypothetical protein
MKISNFFAAIKEGAVLGAILWRLEKLGIIFKPYYIIQEREQPGQVTTWGEDVAAYASGFLGRDDIGEISSLGGHLSSTLVHRFDHGHLCFGLRLEENIVAYMWCDLKQFNFPGYQFNLGVNEAYLYDALVVSNCRGKGLAPYMRIECYRALGSYSKDTFFSYSDYSNTPAIRFKKKLGARFLKLCLYVNLWGKYSRNWVLRDFHA